MVSTGLLIGIIVGIILLLAFIGAAIYFFAFNEPDETAPPLIEATPGEPETDPLTGEKTDPLNDSSSIGEYVGREYTFHSGQDSTWSGQDDSIVRMPFTSVDDSNRVCDAMPKCRAWVRYSGNSYYRPRLASQATKWPADYVSANPNDGSYVPTPELPTRFRATRKYVFKPGQDSTFSGSEDAIAILPFASIEESGRICDAIPGCKGWVRYSDRAFYRPKIAATPAVWSSSYIAEHPEDGSYIPA